MKKIAIDMRMLNASGIGIYIQSLIPRILDLYPHYTFFLLGCLAKIEAFLTKRASNVHIIDCNSPIYSIREQLELAYRIPRDIDLFWSPHYNIPLAFSGTLMVTIHDLCHLALPQLFRGPHKQFYARMMFSSIRRKANRVLSVSQFTQNEILRLIRGIDRDRITVIHNGIDETWFSVPKLSRPYDRPYLVYVGNVKPHKNVIRLLGAFESLLERIPQDLLIIGQTQGFKTQNVDIMQRIEALKDRVVCTGPVSYETLKQYVVHAEAMVFPSLYEGFGLPPIEAMACGCPVIVSDAASLPEICADAALYCNPYDETDIADNIVTLVTNHELKQQLCRKGIQHAKTFSWDKSARHISRIIDDMVQ